MSGLRLTPRTLEAAYDYLRTTPPFDRWGLPPGGDVKFVVSRRTGEFGRYQWLGHRHCISMSSAAIGQTSTLIRYIGHEAIHLHLQASGQESKSSSMNVHNAAFRRYAAQACRAHGWDLKAFY